MWTYLVRPAVCPLLALPWPSFVCPGALALRSTHCGCLCHDVASWWCRFVWWSRFDVSFVVVVVVVVLSRCRFCIVTWRLGVACGGVVGGCQGEVNLPKIKV